MSNAARLGRPGCGFDAPDDARAWPEDAELVFAIWEEVNGSAAVRGRQRRSDELARGNVPEPQFPVVTQSDERAAIGLEV